MGGTDPTICASSKYIVTVVNSVRSQLPLHAVNALCSAWHKSVSLQRFKWHPEAQAASSLLVPERLVGMHGRSLCGQENQRMGLHLSQRMGLL